MIKKQVELNAAITKLKQSNKELEKQRKKALLAAQRGSETAAKNYLKLTDRIVKNKNALKSLTTEQTQVNKEFQSIEKGISNWKNLTDTLFKGKIKI